MLLKDVRSVVNSHGTDLETLKQQAFSRRGRRWAARGAARAARIEALERRTLLSAGDLDTSFDDDGIAVGTTFVADGTARGVAVQADGRVVVALAANDGSAFNVRRYTAAGALDTSFGGDGTISLGFNGAGPYSGEAVLMLPGGKIAVAGNAGGQFAVARLNADGSPDTTFSGDGMLQFSMGTNTSARDLALQADGKLVIAGAADGLLAAARITTGGSLDTTFSGDGKTTISLAVGLREWANAVTVQGDGKIVLAGGAEVSGSDDDFAVVRLTTSGALDSSFAGDGSVVTDFTSPTEEALDVVVQSDGKIVAAGGNFIGNTVTPQADYTVARYNINGTLDTTFGSGGRVALARTGTQRAEAVILQGTKIVVGGPDGDNTDFGLARLNANGSLDTTFGDGGTTQTNILQNYDVAYALAQAPDGKLVLAGNAEGYFISPTTTALVRYSANGVIDPSFGINGKVSPSLTSNLFNPTNVLVQGDNKVIGVGSVAWIGTGEGVFFLTRHNADGSLDTSFGDDGYVFTDFGIATGVSDAVFQPDGKIVVVGYSANTDPGWPIHIARYNPDGSIDTTFSGDGKDTITHMNFSDVSGVAIAPDGKIVLAGQAASSSGFQSGLLIRYNTNGTLDNTFGSGGILNVDFGTDDEFRRLQIQPDGKLLTIFFRDSGPSSFQQGIARLNPNGTFDTTFGSGGLHDIHYTGAFVSDFQLQSDGKVVVGARLRAPDGETFNPFLYRITAAGAVDSSFINGPITDPAWGENVQDLAIQPDGRIVLSLSPADFSTEIRFGRVLTSGQPDPSFGTGGVKAHPPQPRGGIGPIALAPDGKIIGFGTVGENYAFYRLLNDTAVPPDDNVYIQDRVVHVDGTSGDDVIATGGGIFTEHLTVTFNGEAHQFAEADFDSVLIRGLAGNDSLNDQSAYATRFEGDDGNDFVDAAGDEIGLAITVVGGAGDDVMLYNGGFTNGLTPFFGGTGRDKIIFRAVGSGDLDLRDFPTVEDAVIENTGNLTGNALNNHLTVTSTGQIFGGDGDDTLASGDSADSVHLFGENGNDLLLGTSGASTTVDGGAGNDTLVSSGGTELLKGGVGTDEVTYASRTAALRISLDDVANDGVTGEGDNVSADIERVRGGSGADWIDGSAAGNILFGLAGDDTLVGFGGNDALFGGGGNDRVYGGSGDDYLEGNGGNDSLHGEAGSDEVLGHEGDDTVDAGDGDTVRGQDGNDVVNFSASGPATLTLEGGLRVGDVDTLNVNSGSLTFNSDVNATTANLAIRVADGAAVNFNSTQHLDSLTLAAGAVAAMPANGNRYLFTKGLGISATATLDLADNDLLIDYSGASHYDAIRDYVLSGRDTGTGGIISSTSQGDTVLAVFDNAAYGADEWLGESIDETTIIGKYTYYGDADLNGAVTSDDYVAVDVNLGVGPGTRQWFHGDFDFDGNVTSDEYVAIDVNLGKGSSEPLATSESDAEMAEVETADPETNNSRGDKGREKPARLQRR